MNIGASNVAQKKEKIKIWNTKTIKTKPVYATQVDYSAVTQNTAPLGSISYV